VKDKKYMYDEEIGKVFSRNSIQKVDPNTLKKAMVRAFIQIEESIVSGEVDLSTVKDLTWDLSNNSEAASKFLKYHRSLEDSNKAFGREDFEPRAVSLVMGISFLEALAEITVLRRLLKLEIDETEHWKDLLEMVSKEKLEEIEKLGE
jgi:hypothetical protein